MEQDALVVKASATLSDIDFTPDGLCIWNPQTEKDAFQSGTEVNDDEKGRGASFKVRRWRWIASTRTEEQKEVS